MPSRQSAFETEKPSGRRRAFARLAAVLFVFAFATGVGSHWLLENVFRQHHAFGTWIRMYDFHHRHPAQYIAIVAFFYALLVAAWGVCFRATGWLRYAGLLGVFALILQFSSAAAGALWAVHDMQAGHFPPWDVRWRQIGGYVVDGLNLGWRIVLLSFPFNLITITLAYAAALFFTQPHLEPTDEGLGSD